MIRGAFVVSVLSGGGYPKHRVWRVKNGRFILSGKGNLDYPVLSARNMNENPPQPRKSQRADTSALSLPVCRRTEYAVLRDLDEALGLVLWSSLRATRMWLETPTDRRGELAQEPSAEARDRFAFAQVQAPELAPALRTFVALSRAPLLVETARLADACALVGSWAEARSLHETALQFAESAATLEPASAARSLVAGRVCRRAGELDRAAEWYERAIYLCRGRSHTDIYIRANLGAAALYYHQGRLGEAKPFLEAAARRAQSRNRRDAAAEAQHDLLFLVDSSGQYAEAEAQVRAALEWYPPLHERFPVLLLDYAFILTRNHLAVLALRLLREVVPLLETPSLKVLGWGNLARAAGIAGDRLRFQEARERTLEMAPTYDEFAPAACINVAVGAQALGEWNDAERFAATAVQMARARQDGIIEQDALALLDAVAIRQAADPGPAPAHHDAEALIKEMILRIQRWARGRPTTRHRRRKSKD